MEQLHSLVIEKAVGVLQDSELITVGDHLNMLMPVHVLYSN